MDKSIKEILEEVAKCHSDLWSYCNMFAQEGKFFECKQILDQCEDANQMEFLFGNLGRILEHCKRFNNKSMFMSFYKTYLEKLSDEQNSNSNLLNVVLRENDLPIEWIYDLMNLLLDHDMVDSEDYKATLRFLKHYLEEKNKLDFYKMKNFIKKRQLLTQNEKDHLRIFLTRGLISDRSRLYEIKSELETEECGACGYFNNKPAVKCELCDTQIVER